MLKIRYNKVRHHTPRTSIMSIGSEVKGLTKYGCGSVPVLAVHCHPPLFAARSPSIKLSIKYFSPSPGHHQLLLPCYPANCESDLRQSIIKSLTRKQAATILTRFSIHPTGVSSALPYTWQSRGLPLALHDLMAASTIG